MQKTHILNTHTDLSDISKGQKIVAAIYLVTNHLVDTDPIKTTLRNLSVSLIDSVVDQRAYFSNKAINLLGAATIAGIINEKNVSIISAEIKTYAAHPTENLFGSFFDHKQTTDKKILSDSMSLKDNTDKKYEAIYENKSKRQSDILSFINEKKAVGIKDISALFLDVSEKTIQRELGTLVEKGKITKRGSKRWSIYMAL